jgi:hypothetical protein
MPTTKSHSVLRPHGTIIITDPALGRELHMDVLTCVHCQKGWVVEPGSGKRRGFCMKCNGVTCGAEKCDACLGPIEKRIELYEAGKLAAI